MESKETPHDGLGTGAFSELPGQVLPLRLLPMLLYHCGASVLRFWMTHSVIQDFKFVVSVSVEPGALCIKPPRAIPFKALSSSSCVVPR